MTYTAYCTHCHETVCSAENGPMVEAAARIHVHEDCRGPVLVGFLVERDEEEEAC